MNRAIREKPYNLVIYNDGQLDTIKTTGRVFRLDKRLIVIKNINQFKKWSLVDRKTSLILCWADTLGLLESKYKERKDAYEENIKTSYYQKLCREYEMKGAKND